METTATEITEFGTRYRISPSLRSTHGQDGAVVLDVGQGRMFSLNPVASRMLELMKTDAGESEIADVIAHEFVVSPDRVEKDLVDFVKRLAELQLIEVLSSQSALHTPTA